MNYVVGIDLGATQIKFVAVDSIGYVIKQETAETADDGSALWVERIREMVASWRAEWSEPPEAIGLCAPGLAAADARSIAYMPGRMRGLEGLNWTQTLDIGAEVRVLNDAHAALLGETRRGAAGRGIRNAVMLTLGTGVGGAFLCDGHLLRGSIGRAGHLGHISLDLDGPTGITGTPGSLEDAIGKATLEARSNGRFKDTAELVAAMDRNDVDANEVWNRSVRALGAGIVSIINVVDPEVVILGGGMAEAGDALFAPLQEYLNQHEWRPGGARAHVVHAALGRWAGAIGAAHYALTFGEQD